MFLLETMLSMQFAEITIELLTIMDTIVVYYSNRYTRSIHEQKTDSKQSSLVTLQKEFINIVLGAEV